MKRNARRDRTFWLQLVEQYEAGTFKSQTQFALDHGVNPNTFKKQLHILRKLPHVSSSPSTHPLPFVELTASSSASSTPLSAAILHLPNDVILEFTSLPDPAFFTSLLNSLRVSS